MVRALLIQMNQHSASAGGAEAAAAHAQVSVVMADLAGCTSETLLPYTTHTSRSHEHYEAPAIYLLLPNSSIAEQGR
jgi:hypothetical protein